MPTVKSLVPGPGILEIDPYVPGESALPGDGPVIKLASNETPLGPSAQAVAAFTAAAGTLERYPDGSARALREALGARHGIDPAQIVCGAGSDELLSLLAYAYLKRGDEAIYTAHGFLVYRLAILASGATPVVAPERDRCADVDAILECVTPRTRAVFLANPNNPTGTYLPFDTVERLRRTLPDNVLLVLDGAYAEYVRRNDYEAGLALVARTDNTVMTRTFSKIYGLAALRVGWAACPPDVADVLNRIRGPFNLTGPSLAAATAALADIAHMEQAAAHNDIWLPWLTDEIGKLGLEVTPSVANFVLVHFADSPGRSATDADAFLKDRRIIVRRMGAYGLPGALRVTIGTEDENRAVVAALHAFMGDDR